MMRDEIVSLIKQRCRRDADTTLDTRIITEMKYVQDILMEGGITLPNFLLSENLTASTVQNEERIPLPVNVDSVTGRDFLREYEEGALWIYDTTELKWKKLIKEDYDDLLETYPSGTDIPKYYSLDGDYFRLKPTPDNVYTIRMKCYLREPVLDSNIANKWTKFAADWLLGEVGKRIAKFHLRDEAIRNDFEMEANSGKSRLFVFDEARKHANREYEMGD